MSPPLLQRNDTIGAGERYVVRKKIGEGQFAEVYEVDDTTTHSLVSIGASDLLPSGRMAPAVLLIAHPSQWPCLPDHLQYALKLERRTDVHTVKQECKVLRRLHQCRQVCKVHDSGVHRHRHFIVMDLLGHNLAEVRSMEIGGLASAETAVAVGSSLLTALQGLHQAGFIHRDVKPANFAVYPPVSAPSEGEWVLLDFGLARRYVDDDGNALAEREDASFRGSTTYASVHAHLEKDLSRRDDLWSWFYVLVELLEGQSALLPCINMSAHLQYR